MKRFLIAFSVVLATLSGDPLRADDTYPVDEPQPAKVGPQSTGRIRVAVFDYRASGAVDTHGAYLSSRIAHEVRKAMEESGRFEIFEVARGLGYNTDPYGRTVRDVPDEVEYVIYGDIESANLEFDRDYEWDEDRKKRRVKYSAEADVSVRHFAVNVRTGQVWQTLREDGKATKSVNDDYPRGSEIEDLFESATDDFGQNFVRQLVRPVEGRVVKKDNRFVMVNLGRRHGVGLDTDFRFYRSLSGGAKPQAIQVRPSRKHQEVFPVVARPVKDRIFDDYCIVQIGYYGGTFFDNVKFKASEFGLATLKPGDVAILSPRPRDD